MENFEKDIHVNLVVAPYVQKATALRGVKRYVGGNQFRHALATFAILIDYHYTDAILLKASIIHDLLEDVKNTSHDDIRSIDHDGPQVLNLVLEVTRRDGETKEDFLDRILQEGSDKAKILKCADRISNLTDLHPDSIDKDNIINTLFFTKEYVIPMAEEVNKDMLFELQDLLKRRETYMEFFIKNWPVKKCD
jgi:GTP pyrophosphokinase